MAQKKSAHDQQLDDRINSLADIFAAWSGGNTAPLEGLACRVFSQKAETVANVATSQHMARIKGLRLNRAEMHLVMSEALLNVTYLQVAENKMDDPAILAQLKMGMDHVEYSIGLISDIPKSEINNGTKLHKGIARMRGLIGAFLDGTPQTTGTAHLSEAMHNLTVASSSLAAAIHDELKQDLAYMGAQSLNYKQTGSMASAAILQSLRTPLTQNLVLMRITHAMACGARHAMRPMQH